MNVKYSSIFFSAVIFAALLSSGCISDTTINNKGVSFAITPDPEKIIAGNYARLYIDATNNGKNNIQEIEINVFNTGILKKVSDCKNTLKIMYPGQMITTTCLLKSPSDIKETKTTDVSASIKYTKIFSVSQIIELITEGEYQRQSILNKIEKKPKSYSYNDDNIRVDITFSSELPIILKNNSKEYMYVTITNIGNGYISDLSKDDISIKDIQHKNIIKYEPPEIIHPINNVFPRLTFELKLPNKISYLQNDEIIIEIKYDYDIRKTTSFTITK